MSVVKIRKFSFVTKTLQKLQKWCFGTERLFGTATGEKNGVEQSFL